MTPELTELIAPARVVVWDFDGPICRLFAGHEAKRAAAGPRARLERQGRSPELEELLTQEELRAVSSAMPTAYADPLIRTWTALGARMAVATDISPRAVRAYLDSRGLSSCFGPRVYGRTQDLRRLDPDPPALDRVLDAMGAVPAQALVIGDAPACLRAARAAGVPFLGYVRDPDGRRLLRQAGASTVVGSLEPVLSALRAGPSGRTPPTPALDRQP